VWGRISHTPAFEKMILKNFYFSSFREFFIILIGFDLLHIG